MPSVSGRRIFPYGDEGGPAKFGPPRKGAGPSERPHISGCAPAFAVRLGWRLSSAAGPGLTAAVYGQRPPERVAVGGEVEVDGLRWWSLCGWSKEWLLWIAKAAIGVARSVNDCILSSRILPVLLGCAIPSVEFHECHLDVC